VDRFRSRAYARKKKQELQLLLRREVEALVDEHRKEFSNTAQRACAVLLNSFLCP